MDDQSHGYCARNRQSRGAFNILHSDGSGNPHHSAVYVRSDRRTEQTEPEKEPAAARAGRDFARADCGGNRVDLLCAGQDDELFDGNVGVCMFCDVIFLLWNHSVSAGCAASVSAEGKEARDGFDDRDRGYDSDCPDHLSGGAADFGRGALA